MSDRLRQLFEDVKGRVSADVFQSASSQIEKLGELGFEYEEELLNATIEQLEARRIPLPKAIAIKLLFPLPAAQPSVAPPGPSVAQQSEPDRNYVKLIIKAKDRSVEACVLVDTGYTKDLLLSAYKCRQLNLQPDGASTVVTAAKAARWALDRWGTAEVSLLGTKDGQEFELRNSHLEVWALEGTDEVDASDKLRDIKTSPLPEGLIQPVESSRVSDEVIPGLSDLDALDDDRAASSQPCKAPTQASEHGGPSGFKIKISPIKRGRDKYEFDAILGKPGMIRLGLGLDKDGHLFAMSRGGDMLLDMADLKV